MNTKEVAQQILAESESIKANFINLQCEVETVLKTIFKKVITIIGSIPDEDTFIRVCADIADELYNSDNPMIEMVDGFVIYTALKSIDKTILDKYIPGWFDKIKKLAQE
ncbi:MAG: hypothetical protein PHX21_13770 [bacterium]|nr:hypothetical protein [bacterium]